MADEYANERTGVYREFGFDSKTIFVDCTIKEGNVRALAQAYNNAADLAVDLNFDLLITLQDYIWIPDNGIEMFVEDHAAYPNCLITGLVSLSEAPRDDELGDTSDRYSIFKTPLTERPRGISWHDVRGTDMYTSEEDIVPCAPQHWEANWGAVPVELLRKGLRWDESYDEGVAYENQDFSKRAERDYGVTVILDKRNHGIGIPHRAIWPAEEDQLKRYNNRWFHEERWGKT
jgi:hypothetical protein